MSEGKPLTDAEIHVFRKKYLEQVEFGYWQERLFTAYRRYEKFKKPENKAKYLVEIYSLYIQVVEILLVNMYALTVSPQDFLASLAVSNQEIREFGEKIRDNRKFLQDFTHNFLYKIRGVARIDDESKKKIEFDIDLLRESLKDYLDNYGFLNSYKHGFRVHSTHGENYLSIGTSPDNMMRIFSGDSMLTYYEFKKIDGELSVSEVRLTFNNMRIVTKALFIVYYLQNMRIGALAAYKPKKVQYPIFYIKDLEAWKKDFGGTRFTSELFRVIKV